MCAAMTVLGYIDPNTSQHVFSLLAPILACLATLGGLTVTAIVLVRHRITSYFRRASWTKRLLAGSLVIGVVALAVTATLWILL
jgi:hypothetical protein